jgi:hypothetical protein
MYQKTTKTEQTEEEIAVWRDRSIDGDDDYHPLPM